MKNILIQMGISDLVSFVRTYRKSIILFITPIILIPLLTVDAREVIDDADLCQIYTKGGESCDETIGRLDSSSDKPPLFKVCYNKGTRPVTYV